VVTRSNGDRRLEAVVLDELAEVHLRMGAIDEARARYGEALAIQRAIEDRRNTALSLYGIARVERAAGKLEDARAAIDEALTIVEAIRGGALPRELRVSFRAATGDLYEAQIDVLMALHDREPSAGWAARALEASERARARALTDALQKVAADIHAGTDQSLTARVRALRTRLTDKESVRTHLLTSNAGPEAAAETEREIAALVDDLRTIEANIRGTSPRYAQVVAPQALTLAQIQGDVLDAKTALVEFTVGSGRSFVWVVTNERLTVQQLPGRADIERLVRLSHAKLTERNRSLPGEAIQAQRKRVEHADREAWALTRELYDTLLRPVRDAIGARRLLIVPDGPLHLVPFSALTDGTTSLAEQREVVLVPSATALATLRRAPPHAKPAGSIAILADPVFRADDARLGKPAANIAMAGGSRGTQPALPRLRFSRREAAMVDGIVPAQDRLVALDFDARRELIDRASAYRILHFATHAVVDNEAPERSSLVLSLVDRNGAAVDGWVRLPEIYNLDLRSELVVLSACDTAAGKEMRGEGLMSLTHGFMYAGARRVVSTLWRIDDRATAELMKHFYRGVLRDDLSPAVALRKAQQQLARDKRWSSPYYWAAFVLQGDPG
jgi:CHAT domain-containing protein